MILIILSYLGGVLTILSPCILPVLPFVFARADQPFVRSGLPLLIGMAVTFALLATLATVGGSWAVNANQYGRIAAMLVLSLFALTLLFDSLAEHLTRPIVALGNRLSQSASSEQVTGFGTSLLLGAATGLLWSPCAGPILGLILTGAAVQGASASTTLLLLAYALGAATSLAAALLIGGRLFVAMKKSLGASQWIRRILGVAVLAGVAAIALGLDTGLLTKLSLAKTAGLEQVLVDKTNLKRAENSYMIAGSTLPVEGEMPPLDGAIAWLNSPPLTREELRGKVVLVDFWTYSCINCIRTLPYLKAWAEKYKDSGLVVIGVHAPEFAFEKDIENVKRAVADLGVTYPVALDNDFKLWKGFDNRYWPAHFFVDTEGRIRYHHFGEGEYELSEKVIQQLLMEGGFKNIPFGIVDPKASGAQATSDHSEIGSPETYIGYARAKNFVSGPTANDAAKTYGVPEALKLNQWGLVGSWTIAQQKAVLDAAPGKIIFRFKARDVHLVLGPAVGNKPVRFRVKLDGAVMKDALGSDVNEQGEGVVSEERLYQLIRQKGDIGEHTFEIEFLDPGVQAFAFTFG